jgi:hypothetical protein
MNTKWILIINMARKFALPALFGSLVLWLIHHNLQPWADVVCAIGDALLIPIQECK